MDEATIALTVMTFLIFVIFLGFLVWGFRSGQFKNIEEPKYRMLEDGRKEHDIEEEEKEEPKGGEQK
jgi:cbb3-type cytochrome oxidase maturation protein